MYYYVILEKNNREREREKKREVKFFAPRFSPLIQIQLLVNLK